MNNSAARRAMLLLTAWMCMTALAACNPGARSGAGADKPSGPEPVTLNIMLWGDKPRHFDDVVAEFERQTMNTLHLKLNVTFTPQADYINNLKLKLAAGGPVDIAFDAPWMNMNAFIGDGSYANLDPYFNNDRYPGLKQAFGSAYLDSNRFSGPDGRLHTYGVPLGQYWSDLNAVYYRKDLAAKYGLSEIGTYPELLTFFDRVLKEDKNLVPFVMKNDGSYSAIELIVGNNVFPDRKAVGIWDLDLAAPVRASVYIRDGRVKAVSLAGDPEASLRDFPQPFNRISYASYVALREWHDKGYIEKEPLSRKYAREWFTAGKSAAMIEGLANLQVISSQLKAGVPDSELGLFLVQQQVRDKVQPNSLLNSDARVWNFLCIPQASAHKEEAVAFLNWLFASRDHHDLFEYGIPGVHWEPVGSDQYRLPDGVDPADNYVFPGYLMTWNPKFIRLPADIPDELADYFRYQADEKSYYKSPFAGFVFDQAPVKDALANPAFTAIQNEATTFELGMVADPAAAYAKLLGSRSQDAKLQHDIGTIKAEIMKQVQAYMDLK